MAGIGVFPGTFNPVTVGHLAIAEAAWRQHRLERIDLVVNEQPLAKQGHPDLAPLTTRISWLEQSVASYPWAQVRVTTELLVVDIAAGYDVVILGADKWWQVHDPAFYSGDAEARDRAVARLPTPAIAPRNGLEVPARFRLDLPPWVQEVSATAVRSGRSDWHGVTPPPT
jgi:hypothetical protein